MLGIAIIILLFSMSASLQRAERKMRELDKRGRTRAEHSKIGFTP